MSNSAPLSQSRWVHWKEISITTLVSWIPLTLGILLRRLTYQAIMAKIGRSVWIEPSVELVNVHCLELGNKVRLERYVRIRNIGSNKVKIGNQSILNHGVHIKLHTGNGGIIQVGERTTIGAYSILSGRHIKVGDDCLIAPHVGVFASSHVFTDINRKIRDQGQDYKGIVIEDNCWLGSGVKVLDGVTIGQGSIIGANAVVTKDIPPYSIAVGAPAKVIQTRSKFSQSNSSDLAFAVANVASSLE